MKSGSGSGGGVCVCGGARSGPGGEVSARESFAVRPRGECECEGEARRSIVIARPLPLSPRNVRGVIGLEPNANTRGGGGRESESRERCDANWCRSITGACWEQFGMASASASWCCCRCDGLVCSDLEDGFSGAAIVPVACCRRLNVSLDELAGEGMSCRDRVGVQGGCDADLGSG